MFYIVKYPIMREGFIVNGKELDIYKKIKKAIILQKLRPNTQLVEKEIAESFDVSRTPVRNVLRRLQYERLVKIIENKGAFVAGSTVEEAKEVFEMRKILEVEAVRKACQNIDTRQLMELENIVEDELQKQDPLDYHEALQMSGCFHLKIAKIAGNSYFSQYLEDLISLTYVIIAIYGRGHKETCGPHHHMEIFHAIKDRDEELAEELVIRHLEEIEANLQFNGELQYNSTLSEIFN